MKLSKRKMYPSKLSLAILVCGPISGRVEFDSLALSLTLLSRELTTRFKRSKIHVQTYYQDAEILRGLLFDVPSITISVSSDPGPDKEIESKKGFANTSRMFKLGVEGLENVSQEYCCKTRVELIPTPDGVSNFIEKTVETVIHLGAKGDYSIAFLREHYSGPLAYRKGTLCSIPDTFLIAETKQLREVFRRSEVIWREMKQAKKFDPHWPPVNEQLLGRAYYEYAADYFDDFPIHKFDFRLKPYFLGRRMEKSKFIFLSYSDFSFYPGRFSSMKKNYVSSSTLFCNNTPYLRAIVDFLFIIHRFWISYKLKRKDDGA